MQRCIIVNHMAIMTEFRTLLPWNSKRLLADYPKPTQRRFAIKHIYGFPMPHYYALQYMFALRNKILAWFITL